MHKRDGEGTLVPVAYHDSHVAVIVAHGYGASVRLGVSRA